MSTMETLAFQRLTEERGENIWRIDELTVDGDEILISAHRETTRLVNEEGRVCSSDGVSISLVLSRDQVSQLISFCEEKG